MTAHSTAVKTRAEMEAEYGAIPPLTTTWRICRAHGDVTYITDDNGEHWIRKNVVYASERARRDLAAQEMAAIQRDLK